MAKANEEKTLKTFIVQRTYESIVKAYDRDGAIAQVANVDPDNLVAVKCGTPKQMKRTDVE